MALRREAAFPNLTGDIRVPVSKWSPSHKRYAALAGGFKMCPSPGPYHCSRVLLSLLPLPARSASVLCQTPDSNVNTAPNAPSSLFRRSICGIGFSIAATPFLSSERFLFSPHGCPAVLKISFRRDVLVRSIPQDFFALASFVQSAVSLAETYRVPSYYD